MIECQIVSRKYKKFLVDLYNKGVNTLFSTSTATDSPIYFSVQLGLGGIENFFTQFMAVNKRIGLRFSRTRGQVFISEPFFLHYKSSVVWLSIILSVIMKYDYWTGSEMVRPLIFRYCKIIIGYLAWLKTVSPPSALNQSRMTHSPAVGVHNLGD